MLLGGLWHGAGWTFILWGFYHGLLLLLNHAWRGWRGDRQSSSATFARPISVLVTFLAVMFGWVLFRSETFAAARLMFEALLHIGSGAAADARAPSDLEWARIIGLLAAVWLLPNTVQLMRRSFLLSDENTRQHLAEDGPRPAWRRLVWRPSLAWAAVAAVCLALALMPMRPRIEFLYFQF